MERIIESSKEKSILTGKPSIDRPWEKFYSERVMTTEFPKMTVYDCVYNHNKDNLDRNALNFFGRLITYRELFQKIEETEKAFRNQGIKRGDIVTMMMPTTPETVYAFYALSKIGAIANMVDPRTSAEGLKHYINEVNSKLLIIFDAFNKKVSNFIDETKIEKIVNISVTDSLPLGVNIAYKVMQLFEMVKGKRTDIPKNRRNSTWKQFIEEGKNNLYQNSEQEEKYENDTPVAIVHTGGTTGSPKSVLLSNDNFNAVAYQYKISGMHLLPGHKFLNIMPPFIAYGLGCGIHMPLLVGMTSVLVPEFEPEKFDQYITKYKPNHMAGVPSHFDYLVNSKKLKNKSLDFLITAAVGGDEISTTKEIETNKFLKAHHAPNSVIKGYGMTEQCSLATACINDINKVGSVGIPLPQNIISVFEPDTDKELSYYEPGEICITGKTLMLEYYKNNTATIAVLKRHKDGKIWLHTKDIGHMDDEGFVFIEQRIKDVIIRHDGFKVFPSAIKEVILSHPAVEDCVVVGVPDNEHSHGSLPKAHIILKKEYYDDQEVILMDIDRLCKQRLPEYVIPYKYQVRSTYPLTPIGKIDYITLSLEDLSELGIESNSKTHAKKLIKVS